MHYTVQINARTISRNGLAFLIPSKRAIHKQNDFSRQTRWGIQTWSIELLFLHVKTGQLTWSEHPMNRPRGRHRTDWRDYRCSLPWECFGIPLEELGISAGEKEILFRYLHDLSSNKQSWGFAQDESYILLLRVCNVSLNVAEVGSKTGNSRNTFTLTLVF